jgi:hypothetical protein
MSALITPKIGRNDLCPCGSKKKYKKCCFATGISVEEIFEKNFIDTDMNFKMSEAIIELAYDLLDEAKTKTQVKSAIDIACAAWNLAMIDSHTDKSVQTILSEELPNEPDMINQDMRHIVKVLMQRKNIMYSDINRVIIKYYVRGSLPDLDVQILSMPIERNTPIGALENNL